MDREERVRRCLDLLDLGGELEKDGKKTVRIKTTTISRSFLTGEITTTTEIEEIEFT